MADLIMLPVTQDVAGMLMSELSETEDRKPRHSLGIDMQLCAGLFTVASVQDLPGPAAGPRIYRAAFRQVDL
jgi:hypothetical protein